MKYLLEISIGINQFLKIELPVRSQKQNLYYESTDEINRFDIVKVWFLNNDESLLLFNDALQEVLYAFVNTLRFLLSCDKEIDDIKVGELGKMYDIDTHKKLYKVPEESVVLACHNILTFMYRIRRCIYMEIAPTYPWEYSDPKYNEEFIPFDEYIDKHKPYAVIEIDFETAQDWIKQCEELIKKMT